tara:strand:+ start:147 stop:524 length:378 start_codon:yes stop_codon:yes gene_type:complete
MFEKNKIIFLTTNNFCTYSKTFRLNKRKSFVSLLAYLFDKEYLFKNEFVIQRIADRAGILSLCLSKQMLNKIITEKAIEVESSKIQILNFYLGTNFQDRLLIFIVHIFYPYLIKLKISFFNFQES